MEKIKVAVIGVGGMGNTIIRNIKDCEGLDEIIACDIHEGVLKKTMENHGIKGTTNPEDIWKNPEIKLVYIASDNASHVPLAKAALRSGKSVMTEKPVGLTVEEMDELLAVQKETGGFIQVGLECRYAKLYAKAKEVIDSGEIGKLVKVHYTYSMPPFRQQKELQDGTKEENWRVSKENSGNMFSEKLCHYIDLVRWWNTGSRVTEYVSTGAPNVIPYFEIEDNVHVSYRFDNGVVSHLYFEMTAAPGDNNDLLGRASDLFEEDKDGHKLNYIIVGTEGAIEIDVFQREMRVYHHPGKPGVEVATIAWKYNWEKEEDHTHFHDTETQNRDILRRVLNGEEPSISLEDAIETMKLCLEFSEAQANSQWTVISR